MTNFAPLETQSPLASTIAGLRWYIAAAAVFAILFFVMTPLVMPRGLDRPALVIAAPSPWLAAPAFIFTLGLCGFIASKLLGSRDYLLSLEILCVGVAVWGLLGGTMDDWLSRFHRVPVGASRGPYSALLIEYAFEIVGFAAALGGAMLAIGDAGPPGASWRERLTAYWPPLQRGEKSADGVLTVVVVCAIAALAMLVFMGPRVAHTHKGQVYFSVFAGFAVGTYAALRTLGRAAPIWYALAPVVLGVVGMFVATLSPELPGAFSNLNVIPPSALARPLPVEIISVGIVAVSWMLRTLYSPAHLAMLTAARS